MASLALAFDVSAVDRNASSTFRNVGNAAEKAGKQTSAFGSLTSKAMATAAGAIAGVGLASLLGSAVSAASNLNETVNKSNVIFGQNAGAVRNWSKDAARSFGLSQQAALDAAAGLGNMLTQLGYTGKAAAATSENTVKLAADLGSFNNLDTGDVLDRISGALRGEYDSLQLLIPNINAARVEQEAMAATGKANADQLTAQEKATAVLAIVQRDGAAAADDFAETSDGLANSTKTTAAEFEDLKAQIGQQFLPIAQGAMHFLSDTAIPVVGDLADGIGDLVGWFGDLPGPVQATIGVVGGLIAFKGPLSTLFSTLGSVAETSALKLLYAKDALSSLSGVAGAAKKGLGGLVALLGGPWGVAIAAIAGSFALLSSATEDNERVTTDATDAQRSFADALRDSNGALTENVRRSAAKSLQDAGLLDIAQDAGISLELMTDAILGNADAYDEVAGALEAYRNQRLIASGYEEHGSTTLHDQADAAEDAIANFDLLAGTLSGTAGDQRQLAEATGEASVATVAASEEAQKALDDWLKKLQGIAEGFTEPLSIYEDLLSHKQDIERESAQATADATESSSDSWEDYATNVSVSLDEYAASLEEQLADQEHWRENLGIIAQRAGVDVANYLAQMGEDGIDIVGDMATGTDAEVQRMAAAILADIQHGSADWTAELDKSMKIMAAVGAAGAGATAAEIANQLGLGAGEVKRIAEQYGINLALGINPILTALDRPNVHLSGLNGVNTGGGYWSGGWTGPGAKFTPAGVVHADEYVEPKESLAYYGRGIFEALHKRSIPREMLASLPGYALGGFVTEADIPRPYSTAPYRTPISTAGDAAMDTEYQAVAALVREGGPAGRGLAWARTQVGKPYIWGGVGPLGYDCSGFMSAITNVILGQSPYSRRGSTATFPWSGFVGGDGVFTIGSTANAGGGIGHMAGTLMNVNVESAGGVGVRVGGSARGAHDSLFGTRAHLAMFNGGVIDEPVFGVGASGRSYSFGERGPETVTPGRGGAGGPLDLSDRTIDRLAAAMLRGAGAVVRGREYHQGVNVRSS